MYIPTLPTKHMIELLLPLQWSWNNIRGAIQNNVDFFYNFRTDNRPHMKLAIHIIECTWQVFASFNPFRL